MIFLSKFTVDAGWMDIGRRTCGHVYRGQCFGWAAALAYVIDVPQAVVALHQRAVLMISRSALRLLSSAELQALVAHEIGHEYLWPDFERTLQLGDSRGRQEVELKCDGIAVLTLVALGLDTSLLTDGLHKQTQFNEMLGATANADDYPQLHERQRFVKAVREFAR